MKHLSKNNKFLKLILIGLLLAVTFLLYVNYKYNTLQKENQIKKEYKIAKTKYLLNNTDVLAKAFSVYDITDEEEIYNKNGDEPLPIASLTKIMTVIVTLENHKSDDEINVTGDPYGDHGANKLEVGERWKITDLVKFTLVSSSNGGAFALSQGNDNFLSMMNEKAKKIGMEHTSFFNQTGIDLGPERAGAFASAKDINIAAEYAYKNYGDIFHVTTLPEMQISALSGQVHNIYNTNYILDKIPTALFSKTGNTDVAGGTLCIIFKDGNSHEIAVTVLGSTEGGRFTDMEKIINVLQLNYGSAN